MTGSSAEYCLRARPVRSISQAVTRCQLSAKLGVNVGKPVGAPVVRFPFSQCLLRHGEVSYIRKCSDGGRPGRGDAGGNDRGNPSALGIGKVNDLSALGSLVGRAG